MTKADPAIHVHSPDRFSHPGKPEGYSYQTRRVHSSWNEMESYIKRSQERRGIAVEFRRDGDPRLLRGRRYRWCCGEVQPVGSLCSGCGVEV